VLDLKPIQDRLAGITPGTWRHETTGVAHSGIRTDYGWLYANDGATEADNQFVANAPADIAALMTEVERLKRALRETTAFKQSYNDHNAQLWHAICKHRDKYQAAWDKVYNDGRKVSRTYRIAAADAELWSVLDD
jgi:hypothetical protein